MSQNRLYVGNISFRSTETDLEDAFAAYGTVQSVNVITDRETGRSKGFAFIEMGNDQEAQAAIEGLDGADVGGRNIKVSVARPRPDRGRRY